MKRRDFIKKSSVAGVPLLLNGIPLFAAPSTGSSLFDFLAQTTYGCGKVLVIIQQNGGNDALNTIIPLDQYANLNAARTNIMHPEPTILKLNDTITTGFHPSLTELRDLYNNGKVNIVQAVSYPNPNFSHFRATDIWFSGSASNVDLDTGWIGRALDVNYPNYPAAYPNANMLDPVAIQIGSTLPFSLQGPGVNMGYNVSNPTQLLNVINATTDPAPNNDYGRELTFMRQLKNQSNAYTARISSSYNAQLTQSALYPASGNSLADQLKIVARLIGGGMATPIYIVNHPYSHDTHENQLVTQANNMTILSKAINAFQNDIELMGKAGKVTGMTFSEFGRRVISNASGGTDHGTAAPVIFFGAAVKGGIIGTSPNIPAVATVNSQVAMQYDFRQLYATVMQDWLCLSPAESQTVLGSNFTRLPIFAASNTPLALDGVTLTGQYYQGQSKLTCRSEQNTKYEFYALEFSADSRNFAEVKRISNTSSNDKETYLFTHQVAVSKMFYRIAARDLRGKLDYSNTVMLRANDKQQLIRVYPNPVENFHINVQLFETPTEAVDVTIYDLIGARVYYNRLHPGSGIFSFQVPPTFSKETHYILQVTYGETTTREQIIFK